MLTSYLVDGSNPWTVEGTHVEFDSEIQFLHIDVKITHHSTVHTTSFYGYIELLRFGLHHYHLSKEFPS